MAHVAATSSHLSVMPSHKWQSHPRPSSPSNLSPSPTDPSSTAPSPDDYPPAAPTSSTPVSTILPSTHIWPPLSSPPSHPSDLPSQSLPNLSPLPNVSPSSSSPPDGPDLSVDADTVFRNLLNLHIEGQSQPQPRHPHLPRSVSVHAPPFRPSTTPHQSANGRLASPSMNDLHQEPPMHHHNPYLSSSPAMSSPLLLSLQPSTVGMQISSVYHTQSAGSDLPKAGSAPRGSPVLRPSSVPPGPTQSVHPLSAMSAPPLPHNNQSAPRIKNELYKTEICRSFAESGGFCKYGSKCQFAHGDEELRPVRRHPRYKTKLCRNFVTTGSCPYDARCRFIHASDLPYAQVSASAAPPTAAAAPLTNASPNALVHAQNQLRQHQLQGSDPQLNPHVRDNYVDSLHRLFNPSSSLPTSAAPHLDSLVNTINADQQSESPSGDLQTDKQGLPALPADQVYHANANVFQNYPDNNAIHHTFMHLNITDNDLRYPTGGLSDRDPLLSAHQFGKSVNTAMFGESESNIARHFTSASDSKHESLFSHSAATPRPAASPTATPNGKTRNGSGTGADSAEESANTGPAASTPRSRLPVFRNMASDDDAL